METESLYEGFHLRLKRTFGVQLIFLLTDGWVGVWVGVLSITTWMLGLCSSCQIHAILGCDIELNASAFSVPICLNDFTTSCLLTQSRRVSRWRSRKRVSARHGIIECWCEREYYTRTNNVH